MAFVISEQSMLASISSCLSSSQDDETQAEIRQGEVERYDAFATAMQKIGLVGIWEEKPLLSGLEIQEVLPRIPKGPAFREVMEEQDHWMTIHPGASTDFLVKHLAEKFPDYA